MEFETRNTPDSLCCALQGLSDAQSSDITSMGFGSIKAFNIHNIPTGLGHWLLVNYDHKRNELNVGNRIIKITRSKVHEVLGVPMGKIIVSEKRKARKEDVVREEWRKQFSQAGKITVTHVLKKLKLYKEGGRLFKLNFLVVFNTIMGETTKSESVNQKFLTSLKSEGVIANMDWCSYIITCLKRTKEEWDGTEPYNGPLTFLAVLYAHEQQMRNRPDYKVTPALQYVTTDYLVNLESSIYDNGACSNDDIQEDDQLNEKAEVHAQLETRVSVKIDPVSNPKLPIGPSSARSLSELSANHGHCNRHEPPKGEKLLDDDNDNDDNVIILEPKREQCELMEKFSSCRSGKVCVGGYTVNQSVAKTLEAILKQHGDIAAKCVIKTESLRTPILEAVCEVAKWIQASDVFEKLEEIESRLLDAKTVNIDVSWLQVHLEAIHKRKEARDEYKLRMEMRASTLFAKKAAEINMRKRRVEHAATEEGSKEAKSCVGVVHLVGRNLSDSVFECKTKTDSWVKAAVV